MARGRLCGKSEIAGHAGVSALAAHEQVDATRLGALAHSYGGNITLLLTALDERIRFAGASGSACTYRRRIADGTGLEFAHVIPGVLEVGDVDALIALIALGRDGRAHGSHARDPVHHGGI